MSIVDVELREGVAVVWLNQPPLNVLNLQLRTQLAQALQGAEANPAAKAIVIASRGKDFSAGADIKEFDNPPEGVTLRDVIALIDASAKPVVAAIGGTAFGGGFEIALACDARVVAGSARLALPEVKIGLIPGAGGTQRLPRLVDPTRALTIIASGDPVSGEQAVADGFADMLADDLLSMALATAAKLGGQAGSQRASRQTVDPATRAAFDEAAAALLKKRADEPQVPAIIEAIKDAYDLPFDQGLKREREHFVRLRGDDRAKALRYAFFAERAIKGGSRTEGLTIPKIASVGVIGGGTMGGGIAMAFANKGVPVVLIETDQEAVDRAHDRIASNYAHSARRGSITEEVRAANLSRITATTDYAALADVDLVIEAVFEEMEIKRDIFTRLVASTKPSAILATNTSYLDVDAIAASSGVPERVLGMHFFSPANIMTLVEVVRGAKSLPENVAAVVQAAHTLGKVPVVVGNCHGFVGNRMLYRRSDQVDKMLLQGALPAEIDAALTAFGSKLGPCAMGDLAGLDISWRMRRATGRTAPVADALVEAGRLGQKNRKGYYVYDETGRTPSHDPDVITLIEKVAAQHGVTRRKIEADEIIDRLILPMVNEGARILAEGIADRASDIDLIWLHGYGFPRWRGGPMFYAQTRGLAEVVARLEALATLTADETLRPAPLLLQLAAENRGFN
jgi:3-hydroxyacyl-CoA dehydrogenase